jgi:riboflavin kinase/FMN adenylyltransferase
VPVESLRQELTAERPGGPTAITLGVFDGVHRGHQHLIQRLSDVAARAQAAPVIITFRNHPLSVLRPDVRLALLTTADERLALLRATGVRHVVALTFSRDLSLLTAEEFVMALHDDLGMAHLVVGPDFAMGRDRGGTIPILRELGDRYGFTVETADAFTLNGEAVNSTAVRTALMEGAVELAGEYLGRPFTVEGRVERGAGRGTTLGFPTANVGVEASMAIPADGVYAAWLHVDEAYYPAAASIGTKPTFQTAGPREVEAHVLDFNDDLYGHTVRLEFTHHLRGQERFSSAEVLVKQMRRDVADVRQLLNGSSSSGPAAR